MTMPPPVLLQEHLGSREQIGQIGLHCIISTLIKKANIYIYLKLIIHVSGSSCGAVAWESWLRFQPLLHLQLGQGAQCIFRVLEIHLFTEHWLLVLYQLRYWSVPFPACEHILSLLCPASANESAQPTADHFTQAPSLVSFWEHMNLYNQFSRYLGHHGIQTPFPLCLCSPPHATSSSDQMQKQMASLPTHIHQCSQIIDYTNWPLIILTMTDNYQYFQDYSKHFRVLTQINGLPRDVGKAETRCGNPFPPPVLASALCRMSGD